MYWSVFVNEMYSVFVCVYFLYYGTLKLIYHNRRHYHFKYNL